MSTAPLILGAIASLVVLAIITLHFLLILFTPIPTIPTSSERRYTTVPSSKPEPLPKLEDEATIELSVVVPAYNEDERLGVMIDEAMEYLLYRSSSSSFLSDSSLSGDKASSKTPGNPPMTPTQQAVGIESRASEKSGSASMRKGRTERLREKGVEIIVVDDGSRDHTTQTAQKLALKWSETIRKSRIEDCHIDIRVVTLETNRGKGGAVQHGVNHSRGRLVLFADADGASRFSDLNLLLAAMDRIIDDDGHGMVVGSRAHLVNSDAVVKRSALRNLLMHGFHFFLKTLGVDGIRDTQCGFKLFSRETCRLLFPTLHLPRWSFDVELLLLASLINPPIPVLEIPIAWHEVNGSKIRLGWDSLGMARDLLVLRGNLGVGRWLVPTRPHSRSSASVIANGAASSNGHGNGLVSK